VVKREVIGAHYGLMGWLLQRVTAVVMAGYTLLMLVAIAGAQPLDYIKWRALFATPWVKVATLLFVVSVLLHAWVGVRNIFMDYVKPAGLRFALYVLVILALVAYAGWAARILWSV
jgi:succinate dehydrogenase / fumarate reductase membrane anchor subunit